MTVLINISVILDYIRNHYGASMVRACADWHISPKTLNKLLSGEMVQLDSLDKICKGTGKNLQDLIVMPRPTKKRGDVVRIWGRREAKL